MRWKQAAEGSMTIGDIPAVRNDRRTFKTFKFDEGGRTLFAAAQMVGDGLILTTLSYASLSLVTYVQHDESRLLFNFLYFVLTIGATIIMIFGFARSGVYDISDEFKRIGIFRTVKCFGIVILLLIAYLFI
jgi:hypothetical protein